MRQLLTKVLGTLVILAIAYTYVVGVEQGIVPTVLTCGMYILASIEDV